MVPPFDIIDLLAHMANTTGSEETFQESKQAIITLEEKLGDQGTGNSDNRNLPTRRFDATILKVPQFHKATSKKAVAYRGATSWNSLPPDIRRIPSKDAFKRFQKSAMTGIT